MEVYDYPQFGLQAAICLFTDVKNGPEIRKKIIEAATGQGEEGDALRDAVNFAFVDARLVSRSHPAAHPFFSVKWFLCEDYEHSASADRNLLRFIGPGPGVFADENRSFRNTVGTQPEQQRMYIRSTQARTTHTVILCP